MYLKHCTKECIEVFYHFFAKKFKKNKDLPLLFLFFIHETKEWAQFSCQNKEHALPARTSELVINLYHTQYKLHAIDVIDIPCVLERCKNRLVIIAMPIGLFNEPSDVICN